VAEKLKLPGINPLPTSAAFSHLLTWCCDFHALWRCAEQLGLLWASCMPASQTNIARCLLFAQGVARSMPTGAALDRVAEKLKLPGTNPILASAVFVSRIYLVLLSTCP
jgi:hypothetical protein